LNDKWIILKILSLKNIKDAFLFTDEPFRDNRGGFEVFWDKDLLEKAGIDFDPASAHHSYNTARYTLRGMHYQAQPHGQDKLVSCVSGAAYDVVVDMRTDSPTYLAWEAVSLHAASGIAVYVPKGCAHGFLTLEPHTTIAYLISGQYIPAAARVARWDDPKFNIQWPYSGDGIIMADKDKLASFL
jgi:dTDP-4-dehydrorhamnose 3,5-epimerase